MLVAFIFYSLLFVLLVVSPAVLMLVVLLFLDHERKLWQRAALVIGPIGRLVKKNSAVVAAAGRWPRTMRFFAHRLDPRDPWGLSATLAGIVMFVGLWFFLGVLQDLVAKDPLATLDIRLHNLMPLFRTPAMTQLMLVFTGLGSAPVLSLLCLGIALRALASGRPRLAVTFVLALGGTGVISMSLKTLIGNIRPIDALISLQNASFPSGHMLSGAVVYGLLAAVLLSSQVRDGARALGFTLLLLLIVGIGLSRLYLGVHWPSDILGSLALALIGIAASLFFLYYPQPIQFIDSLKLPLSARVVGMASSTALVAALGATAILSSQTQINRVEPPQASLLLDSQVLRATLPPGLPGWSEDLIGGRMEPISLVLVGSEKDVLQALTRAGWVRADPPTPVRVLQEGLAAARNLPDPQGPATPAFFMDWPQSFTFEKSDLNSDLDPPNIRRRHHTRVWRTSYCLVPHCRRVWVATASLDVGIRLSESLHLPTHRIAPALDNERALIAAELVHAGATLEGSITVTPPLHSKNAAGDPFWTDGRAVLLVMP